MTARWQTGTVTCGGEEIYYEVTGDDDLPAIVLTHGAGGTHAAWFQQVPTLTSNGFRVITWDCRGFGNSTFTSGVHGSAAAVADMAAVLDATDPVRQRRQAVRGQRDATPDGHRPAGPEPRAQPLARHERTDVVVDVSGRDQVQIRGHVDDRDAVQ